MGFSSVCFSSMCFINEFLVTELSPRKAKIEIPCCRVSNLGKSAHKELQQREIADTAS